MATKFGTKSAITRLV